ncbi:hypothetical protein K488DRAFT_54382 [Vararia minispora EC-137]|uniref:Uncharacterized protein n=1 Tax=Vararia minispora EC-137 TaxID=1314806 RepID=A0ACB8QFJ7_9AGAM|nr:hypothetical protein K488DRAFT_54382 [Vararia minispora EC-137]
MSSGAGTLIVENCQANNELAFTGIAAVDEQLCVLVTFFQIVLDPSSTTVSPLLVEFGLSLPVLVALPFFEMSRAERAPIFAFPLPVALWQIAQVFSAGFCFPFFWLAMIVSGHASTKPNKRTVIDQAHADATFFALCAFFLLPSALMAILKDPVVTAIWQPFPIWMGLAWGMHILVRPSSRYGASGRKMVYSTYIFTFALAAAGHSYAVWPLFGDHAEFAPHFIPGVATSAASTLDSFDAAMNLLKWDMIFSFASSMLGSLWFADTVVEFFAIVGWTVLAAITLGPGAALSGTLLWREWRLNGKQW